MKAHRRNGIPTLMLQEGGEATSSAFGRFFTPSQKEYENRERQQFIAALTRSTPSIFTQQTPAQQKLRVPTRDLSRDLRVRTQGGLNSLTGSDYASTISEYYDRSLAPNIDPGIRGVLKEEYDRVVLPRMRVRQGSIAAAQAAGSPLEDDIVRLAKISEADRQEQEGLAGTATAPAETATAPAETATTPTGTATTPAGTAATPAATVAPEGPDAEALRQATGAPTQAEEAAATADKNGAPTPTTNPTVVTSIQSTISDIMGGEEAQFDAGKRLQELKDTFGLGISDMEKAAPGLAFAFSLMGAQRAPGESPFNALVRAAASAGEAATKSNLALKQRERAIDSSLASTVLGEKKAAEQYARSKEWVALWNGGFDERGVPQAEYLRMNADQIQKANEAGLQIVPVNVVSSATTAFATRSKAAAEARNSLREQIMKTFEPTPVDMAFQTIQGKDVKGRRLTGVDPTNGKLREVVIVNDVSGQGRFVGSLLKDSAATIGLVDEMDGLIDQSTGAVNVASAAFDKARSLLNLSKGDTAEDFYRKASEKGGVAFNNLSGFAKSKINVNNAYNELGADGVKRLLNIQGDFSEEDLKKRLSENINNVRGHKVIEKPAENAPANVKSAYEARVRFRAIQNALAAQLAPILLGESGRTISDADRVRVIALLGGFSDFSKAGVLTTAEEMRQSTRMLREILGKYKDSALQDSVRMINSYDEASSYISPITKGALYAPSVDDEEVIRELKGNVQQFNKPNAGQAGQSSGATPVSANELLRK